MRSGESLSIPAVESTDMSFDELDAERTLRDQLHSGTNPEDIWGERAKMLCDNFLYFAKTRNYYGSRTFQDVAYEDFGLTRKIAWEARGYQIGYLSPKPEAVSLVQLVGSGRLLLQPEVDNRLDIYDSTPAVYLCDDGKLRSLEVSVHEDSKLTTEKVRDLPQDVDRLPIVPTIGHYSVSSRPGSYVPREGSPGRTEFVQQGVFVLEQLDDRLLAISLNINGR